MTANLCAELGISIPRLPLKPIRILNRLGPRRGPLAITLHLDLTKASLELIFIFPIYQGWLPYMSAPTARRPETRIHRTGTRCEAFSLRFPSLMRLNRGVASKTSAELFDEHMRQSAGWILFGGHCPVNLQINAVVGGNASASQ